ncbi:MAG: alpha/beta fold hydrolase [Marinoscillum sp.]
MKSIALILTIFCSSSICSAQEFNQFKSFDGTMIAYQDIGTGEPILLVHGFISSGISWNQTILKQQLLETGYRVIIPDLRGNGQSDKPIDPEKYANDAEIKDLMALAKHLSLESYMAIGYSRGSIVLAKLLTLDNRITKAALGGMGIDFTNPDWNSRIMFAEAFGGKAALNNITEGAVNYAQSINADLEILSLLQIYQPVTSIDALGSVKIPVLVIAGDEDKDNGDPSSLAGVIPNSNLILVPGDHNQTYKTEAFASKVFDFIQD